MINQDQTLKSNKPIGIRQNTDLFNMLLVHLSRHNCLKDFKDPFISSQKTIDEYKKQASALHELGINSIKKYNSQVIKKICKGLNTLPLQYLPYFTYESCNGTDLFYLYYNIEAVKIHLSRISLDSFNKITLSNIALSLNEIIYRTSAILSIYKITRKKDENLSDFLFRNSDAEFLMYFENVYESMTYHFDMEKEGQINRKFIYGLRALLGAIIEIQLKNFRSESYELSCVYSKSIHSVDRICSIVLEL